MRDAFCVAAFPPSTALSACGRFRRNRAPCAFRAIPASMRPLAVHKYGFGSQSCRNRRELLRCARLAAAKSTAHGTFWPWGRLAAPCDRSSVASPGPDPGKVAFFCSLRMRSPALRAGSLGRVYVAARCLMSVGLDCRRRAAGGAREDVADRRPPLWSRLMRRIMPRGRACLAMLTYARRPLRFREGRFARQPATRSRCATKYGRAKLTGCGVVDFGRGL